MNFHTYTEKALRTTDDTPSEDVSAYRLIHGCVGLVGELDELLASSSLSRAERGDVWWYIVRISQAVGAPCDDTWSPVEFTREVARREVVSSCFTRSLVMLEMAKKVYFQAHDIELYAADLFAMLERTAKQMAAIDDDLEKTWRANIHKLSKRYPAGKFDALASMNRPTEHEE